MSRTVPVLWLCGPSGVGKTTVGRRIVADLAASGVAAALIDTDMLGLCMPRNEADVEHHGLKSRNLGALWPVFRDAGAACLILAGELDEAGLIGLYAERVPGARITVCRIALSGEDHHARILERNGKSVAIADELVARGENLADRAFTDVRVDTGGLSVEESAVRILAAVGGGEHFARGGGGGHAPPQPGAIRPETSQPDSRPAGEAFADEPVDNPPVVDKVPVLWLHDPLAGGGKTEVGWQLLMQSVAAGVKTAYLDLEYTAAFGPPPADDPDGHRVKLAMVAAQWPVYRADGVRCLVVYAATAVPDLAVRLGEVLPGADLTVCRVGHGATDDRPEAAADVYVDATGLRTEEVARRILVAADWPVSA